MPAFEVPVPVGTTAFTIVDDDDEEYTITIGTDTFTRTGEDGAEIILPLFHGDECVGEVVEGQWRKGWDANLGGANQPFTAILDGSGILEIEGEAAVAGVWGIGWINGQLPIALIDGLELITAMSVPVDDTGAVAARDIQLDFDIINSKIETNPNSVTHQIRLFINVDETGLLITIQKRTGGGFSSIFDGSTYDDASVRSTGDFEGTIWRFVFHNGVTGATAPSNVRHMHVYLKQSDTIANAESETENELSTSPYDISDLTFNIGYPAFQIFSQNTTIFDSGNEAKIGYLRVDYPDFNVKYDVPDANISLGEVAVYDGDPDTTGVRVYDEDHIFANDPYVQNSLIRLQVDVAAIDGLFFSVYVSGAYVVSVNRFWFATAALMRYSHIDSIRQISSEKVIVRVKMTDTATDDDDNFIIFDITMKRGSYFIEFDMVEVNPIAEVEPQWDLSSRNRFGYAGDGAIGDSDLALSGLNTSFTDNFNIQYDPAGVALATASFNLEPTTRYRAHSGGKLDFENIAVADLETIKLFYGYTPFSLIANIFAEAEDETLGGGATTPGNDPNASGAGNNYVLLNAQNETVDYVVVAGTDLPEGRYLAVFRALDSNQVASDFEMSVQNTTDGEYRNEEGADVHTTLTASYAFYSIVFDITGADVTGTDNIRIRAKKDTAGANDIRVDYFLIVPIGDGESFPQDLAHNALRDGTIVRRVLAR